MGEKTSGLGHYLIPTAPAAGTAVAQSASANTYGTKTNIGGTGLGAQYITGVYVEVIAGTNLPTYVGLQLYVTASTVIDTMNVPLGPTSGVASTQWAVYKPIYPYVPVAASTQILAATASSVASAISYLVTLECILQSNVVDDGVAVATVTTVTNQLTAAQIATGVWQDTTAGDFTTALSVGKSVMNGIALGTGLTVNDITTKTGYSLAANQHVIVDSGTVTTLTNLPAITANWLTAAGVNAGALNGKGDWMVSYTQPTGFLAATFPATVASTTNITSASGVSLAASQHVIVDSGTVTTLTNLPAITAGWLTATGIAASALNGKGDWLLSSGYTAPDNTSITAIKAKTDSLTFTAAGFIDSNILKVKGITVTGSGTAASPWGP